MKITIVTGLFLTFFIVFQREAFPYTTKINIRTVSSLPIHAVETATSKANMIAIIGGKGLKNAKGKSKNYLVTQKDVFTNGNLNFYLFPNSSNSEKASYSLRAKKTQADRILHLVRGIAKRNSLPTYMVGFSRGTVDVATFAKLYPAKVKGIVIASGIYTNTSKKAHEYSMEKIIGSNIMTSILVVHHKKDMCKVTQFAYAQQFISSLNAPKKDSLFYEGGKPSGRACGPLHHHGFEAIEKQVAVDIANWIISDATI